MKYVLLIFFLFTGTDKVTRIAKTNELKKLAREAFEQGNYEDAIKNYQILVDSFDISDDNIMLNLGNAYYQTDDTLKALDSYKSIIAGDNKNAKSLAYQQLGVISSKENDLKQALDFFKESLRNNPLNEEARYNYELTKKKLREQEEQNQENQDQQDQQDQNQEDQENKEDQQNQDQQNQDQNQQNENGENKDGEQNEQEQKQEGEQNQEQQNKEGEGEESEEEQQSQPENKEGEEQKEGEQAEQQEGKEGEEGDEKAMPQSIEQKLQEMNLTPEKAQMILEAMRNGEVQYIQQNKRKPTKRKDSSKPDW